MCVPSCGVPNACEDSRPQCVNNDIWSLPWQLAGCSPCNLVLALVHKLDALTVPQMSQTQMPQSQLHRCKCMTNLYPSSILIVQTVELFYSTPASDSRKTLSDARFRRTSGFKSSRFVHDRWTVICARSVRTMWGQHAHGSRRMARCWWSGSSC